MTLEQKILDSFLGKVVRKDLAFLVKGNLSVPTYVLEYLLGQYCASDDPEVVEEGMERVKQIIRENYVHRAEAEQIKGKIKDKGKHRIIDKVTVTLNEKADEFQASFANLALSGVPISADLVRNNPKFLTGNGVWVIATIGYIPGEDVRIRWEIQKLKPIQISNVDMEDFVDQRKNFTTEEWIDFMIHTVGLNPETLNRREKFITLARLLPHIENNYNLIELGPKGTGKSHVYQDLSPYGVLISGGDVTSPRLFVKMSGKKEIIGLVGYWDVVAWDEFEQKPHRSIEAKLVDAMQNYLANKSFNRGGATHEATASMVFVGNTKHTVPYMLNNSHLLESIPSDFLQTGAFIDRIHLYNPGWEIKILKKNSFSKGYGLITDYIAAILHELRKQDRAPELDNYAKFDGTLTERDHNAIRKTFSGMAKLLYPDGKMTDEEAKEIIDFAAEGRKRVKDQMYIFDSTFLSEPVKFQYTWIPSGEKVIVETLENLENNHKSIVDKPESPRDETVVTTAKATSIAEDSSLKKTPRPRINNLMSKIMSIRENQKGVSYKTLFGEYLCGVKEIRIEDPFIRQPYQIDNLVDFLQLVYEMNPNSDSTISIHLSTQNDDDEKIAEIIDSFTDIADELAPLGIDFTWDFKAAHDRLIRTDTGWTITLGRGLDIYEKFNRFSFNRNNQLTRRCKPFNISINRTTE